MESLDSCLNFYGYVLGEDGWYKDSEGKRITLSKYNLALNTYNMFRLNLWPK